MFSSLKRIPTHVTCCITCYVVMSHDQNVFRIAGVRFGCSHLPPVRPDLRILQHHVKDEPIVPPGSDESGVAASEHSKGNAMEPVATSSSSESTLLKSVPDNESHVVKTNAVDEHVQGDGDSATVKPMQPYDDVNLFEAGDDTAQSAQSQQMSDTPKNHDDTMTVKTLEQSNRYQVNK